jgi:hypothetical protein
MIVPAECLGEKETKPEPVKSDYESKLEENLLVLKPGSFAHGLLPPMETSETPCIQTNRSVPDPFKKNSANLETPSSMKIDGRAWSSVVAGTPRIPMIGIAPKPQVDPKKKGTVSVPGMQPMWGTLTVCGIKTKVLVDTGSSSDFGSTNMATVKRLSVRKNETPLDL